MIRRLDAARPFRPGEHVAAFVRTSEECLNMLATSLTAVLRGDAWGIVVAEPEMAAECREMLARHGCDCDLLETEQRLTFLAWETSSAEDVPVSREGAFPALDAAVRMARTRAPRLGARRGRILVQIPSVGDGLTLEDWAKAQTAAIRLFQGLAVPVLWIWNYRTLPPDVIDRILASFPFVAVDRIVLRNVFHTGKAASEISLERPEPSPSEIRRRIETLRKLAAMETALRTTVRRFRRVLRHLGEGVLVLDENGCVAFANAAAAQLFNTSRRALTGRRLGDIFPHVQDEIELPAGAAANGERPASRRYVRYRASALTWKGRAARLITLWDVSPLRREQRRRRLLESAGDTLPVPVIITDGADTIVFANHAFAALVAAAHPDFTAATLEGRKIDEVVQGSPELHRALRNALSAAKSGRSRPQEPPLVHLEAEGEERVLYEIHAYSAETAEDRQPYCAVFFRDVTQEGMLREQLRQAARMEAIGQLAGGVAHDFNNLLMVILAGIEFARDELPEDSPAVADLDEVKTAAEKAASLTRKLLTLSRKQMVQPEIFRIDEAVTDLSKMLRRLMPENIEITVDIAAGDQARVHMDRNEFDRIILNLAVNARDAMGSKGGRLTIATALRRISEQEALELVEPLPADCLDHPFAVIRVSDTGPGIPPEILPRIWDPFFTTKRRESGSGTGLGLATVLGAVRQAGGSIRVESRPGRGATFDMFLPLPREDAMSRAPRQGTRDKPTGSRRILVIEDDAAVRRQMKRWLESMGHAVREADSVKTAGEELDKCGWLVDVVITDVLLPDGDGRDVAQQIRGKRPETAVIIMSGYPVEELAPSEQQPEREGAGAAILAKPFTYEQLQQTLTRVLSESPSERT